MTGLAENINVLKKWISSSDMTDWKELDDIMKPLNLKRESKELNLENRLYEISRIIPYLHKLGVKLMKVGNLEEDAKQFLDDTRKKYEIEYTDHVKSWIADKQISQFIGIDLEPPYINALTVSSKSESWCDTVKSYRKTMKPLIALAQTLVYKCISSSTRRIQDLDPFWDIIMDQEEDQIDEEESDASEKEESSNDDNSGNEEEESEEQSDEENEEESAESKTETTAVTSPPEEDEILELEKANDLVKYLSLTEEEESMILQKKQALDRLKNLKTKTEEELDAVHGNKMRVSKIIESVLKHVDFEEFHKVPLTEQLDAYESIASPCFRLYAEIIKFAESTSARDISWVKRLKELISETNSVCRKLVSLMITKQNEENGSKRQRKATDNDLFTRAALISYAMCHQNALQFYIIRSRLPVDDCWKQLCATIKWTAEFCDQFLQTKMDIKEAAAMLSSAQGEDESEEEAMEDDDNRDDDNRDDEETKDAKVGETIPLSGEESIWSCKMFDKVEMHAPSIRCKMCKSKRQQTTRKCINMKDHYTSLVCKIVVDGVNVSKRNTPARLFKAMKELNMAVPSMLYAHCLVQLSTNQNMCRELLGMSL